MAIEQQICQFDATQPFFFDTEEARQDLYEIAGTIINFIQNPQPFRPQTEQPTQNIPIAAVVFVDTSARPAYRAVLTRWHQEHPSTRFPADIFFINPRGLVSQEYLAELSYPDKLSYSERLIKKSEIKMKFRYEERRNYRALQVNKLLRQLKDQGDDLDTTSNLQILKQLGELIDKLDTQHKESIYPVFEEMLYRAFPIDAESPLSLPFIYPRAQRKITKEFTQKYARLLCHKDKPVLLFDTCVHTAWSINPVLQTMREVGISDIRIGIVDNHRNQSSVEPDLVVLPDRVPALFCTPLHVDTMTYKTHATVVPQVVADLEDKQRARALRTEIAAVITKHYSLI